MKKLFNNCNLRRLLSAAISAVLLLSLSACGAGDSSSSTTVSLKSPGEIKTALIHVMNSKARFIDENGESVLLDDYKSPVVAENVTLNAKKYTLVDLNSDGTNELIIYCANEAGLYIILHYNSTDQSVYGFSLDAYSFLDLMHRFQAYKYRNLHQSFQF